ncbi:MAG: hypothetical protein ABL911_08755 [Gallionella sp.]|nr:hypothetical protein [Gallionella sp.]
MNTEINSLLLHAVLPFAILLGIVMYTTKTIVDTNESQKDPSMIEKIKAGEKSRWKGLLITFVGGLCGAVITYFKPDDSCHYQWLYESIAQTSYMFASAIAAGYIVHGYKHSDPSQAEQKKETENDAQ